MLNVRSSLSLLIGLMTLVIGLATADEPEFRELFNGRDLTGWVVEGASESNNKGVKVPIWSVREGLLHSTGNGYGFLRFDEEFSDFVFHVEYRLAKGANSGIGIRTTKYTGKSDTRPSYASYEIQILDDAGSTPSDHTSGSLYRFVAPKMNATRPTGEWNEMEITCRGPRVHITLNGEVLHDLDQSKIDRLRNKPLKGYLCVQSHGKQVEFRNLRVKDLSNAGAEAK